MKIHPVGAELFHTGGRTDGRRTDTTKLRVAFRNFANVPKNAKRIAYNKITVLALRHRRHTVFLKTVNDFSSGTSVITPVLAAADGWFRQTTPSNRLTCAESRLSRASNTTTITVTTIEWFGLCHFTLPVLRFSHRCG